MNLEPHSHRPPMLTDHPTDSSAFPDSPPWLVPPSLADRQVSLIKVHLVAHLQEVQQVLLSQEQVDRDATPARGLHEVTQKLHVSEYIHHHSHHLGEEGGSSAQPYSGPLPSPGARAGNPEKEH